MQKGALIFCFIVAVVSANPIQDRWNQVHQECQQSPDIKVPDAIFDQLRKGENPQLPENFGLHAFCMLTKLNLQDTQGHILPEEAKHVVHIYQSDEAEVKKIVDECFINKNTKEETALSLFKCFGKHRINIGQL